MSRIFSVQDRQEVYEYGSPGASVVLIEPIHVPEGMAEEAERIRKLAGEDFHLLAVKVNWFQDLSPWPAPAVSGEISFGDGAEETLKKILAVNPESGIFSADTRWADCLPCGPPAGRTPFPRWRRHRPLYGFRALRNI